MFCAGTLFCYTDVFDTHSTLLWYFLHELCFMQVLCYYADVFDTHSVLHCISYLFSGLLSGVGVLVDTWMCMTHIPICGLLSCWYFETHSTRGIAYYFYIDASCSRTGFFRYCLAHTDWYPFGILMCLLSCIPYRFSRYHEK